MQTRAIPNPGESAGSRPEAWFNSRWPDFGAVAERQTLGANISPNAHGVNAVEPAEGSRAVQVQILPAP